MRKQTACCPAGVYSGLRGWLEYHLLYLAQQSPFNGQLSKSIKQLLIGITNANCRDLSVLKRKLLH